MLSFTYNALGRRTGQTNNWTGWGNASFQYDAAGRRTRLTWNDGFHVTYDHDASGATTAIRENGGTPLASFAYDDLGRRTALTRANGVTTSYSYDPGSRLTGLAHDLAGTAADVSVGFAYNEAGQIASRTTSNDAYAWPGAANADRPYAVNGLNQYTASGGTALQYNGRGDRGPAPRNDLRPLRSLPRKTRLGQAGRYPPPQGRGTGSRQRTRVRGGAKRRLTACTMRL